MTSDTLQTEPFPDLTAAEPSCSHSPPSGASGRGGLLRALLAGAVALLVLLLPAQPAASRGGNDGRPGCWNGACAIGKSAALEGPSQRARTSMLEIRRRDTC
jgi:hypothetical protein